MQTQNIIYLWRAYPRAAKMQNLKEEYFKIN